MSIAPYKINKRTPKLQTSPLWRVFEDSQIIGVFRTREQARIFIAKRLGKTLKEAFPYKKNGTGY